MRVYNRKDFMKLPEGVLYSSGKKWYFDSLYVKGDTLRPNDFTCRCLNWISAFDDSNQFDKLEKSLSDGTSIQMQDAYGRDGGFDDEDIFLVFEKEDLEELERVIARAKKVVKDE